MQGEAVHPMSSLEQLKQRLNTPDRRCFCFFHPSLPETPLVILHTALMPVIPSSMNQILGSISTSQQKQQQQQEEEEGTAAVGMEDPAVSSSSSSSSRSTDHGLHCSANASTPHTKSIVEQQEQQQGQQKEQQQQQQQQCEVACFYSISSTESGLAGVDLGNFLIKKVARELLSELPHLRHLVTLSPVPGFRSWLQLRLEQQVKGDKESIDSSNSSSKSGSRRSGNVDGDQQKATPATDLLKLFPMLLQGHRGHIQACWSVLRDMEQQGDSSSRKGSSSDSRGISGRGMSRNTSDTMNSSSTRDSSSSSGSGNGSGHAVSSSGSGNGSGHAVSSSGSGNGSGHAVSSSGSGNGSGHAVSSSGSGNGSGHAVSSSGSGNGSGHAVSSSGSGNGSGHAVSSSGSRSNGSSTVTTTTTTSSSDHAPTSSSNGSHGSSTVNITSSGSSSIKSSSSTATATSRREKSSNGGCGSSGSSSSSSSRSPSSSEMLLQLLRGDCWLQLPLHVQQEHLRHVMLRLCAFYLVHERRRNLALDPVANFHLRNGAELWRVNFT